MTIGCVLAIAGEHLTDTDNEPPATRWVCSMDSRGENAVVPRFIIHCIGLQKWKEEGGGGGGGGGRGGRDHHPVKMPEPCS